MFKVTLEDTIPLRFTTHDPAPTTSSAYTTNKDASTGPTCGVYEEDTDTVLAYTPSVTNLSADGEYRVNIAATTANGFEEGKYYVVKITATVTGTSDSVAVTQTVNIALFQVQSLVDANVTQVSGDSTAADNLESDYDGTGYNKSNSTIGTATVTGDSITVDNIWDEVMEASGTDNETAREIMKLILAVLGGNSAGGGTTTHTYYRGDGSTVAIQATVDTDGNRTVTAKTL